MGSNQQYCNKSLAVVSSFILACGPCGAWGPL